MSIMSRRRVKSKSEKRRLEIIEKAKEKNRKLKEKNNGAKKHSNKSKNKESLNGLI